MTFTETMVVLTLLVSGITLAEVVNAVKLIGSYTARIERSDAMVKQSNELTRQYIQRASDEIRSNADITLLAHERNLILFRELSKFRHELKGIIDLQPTTNGEAR